MKHKIMTNLDTLSAAWELLEEVGLAGLLTGNSVDINPVELMGTLLAGRKLQKFISVVTGDSVDSGNIGLDEAVEIITAFFTDMGSALKGLPGVGIQMKPAEITKNPKQNPTKTPSGK